MKVSFNVKGMHCTNCGLKIEKSVKNVKGVSSVVVNSVNNTASVDYDPKQASVSEIKEAVKKVGYELA